MNEQAVNIKLVQEVEKHPCLYNYELGDYSRKDITEAAWNEIGKKMNMTGAACKGKWKNLRAVFVRHMKPLPSGSDARKKKYYLNDLMQFTLPYVKTHTSGASGNLPDNGTQKIDNIYTESLPIDEGTANLNDETDDVDREQVFEVPKTLQKRVNQSPSVSGVQCKKHPLTEVDETFINYFKEKQEARQTDNNPRKLFLLSLLDEVTKMTDDQMRSFKRRVLNLIDDIMTPYSLQPSPANSYTSSNDMTPIKYENECVESATSGQEYFGGQSSSSAGPHFGSHF